MSAKGWAGIPMLVLAAVTFLLPCALAAYELGTLFTGEGGIYVWAHKTFGPAHGFIAGWLSWVPIFQLLPLGATTIVAHLQLAQGHEWPLAIQVFCQLVVIWIVVGISILRLRSSQGFVRVLFFVSCATAVGVFVAGCLTSKTANPVDSDILTLNLSKYGALYSAAILWLLGVEVPFNMGAEFSNHKRTAGVMLFYGSLVVLGAYLLGIIGILRLTSAAEVDSTTGVAKAVLQVSHPGGIAVALGIVLAVMSQDISYMNAYSRLLFISGIERRLPAVFGQVTEKGRVPVTAMLFQGLGASIVVLVFSSQTQLGVAFNLYLASLVSVWCASLFYIYPGLIIARRKYRGEYTKRASQIWEIPGGMAGAWFVCLWGVVFNGVAIYYVFAQPWTADISAPAWREWLLGIALIIALGGVTVYAAGQSRVKRLNRDAELKRYAHLD